MVRSRLPLVALMGATLGCTQEDSAPATAYEDDGPTLLQRLKGEDTSKGGGIRALTPEERESLLPRPLPVPEGMRAQAPAAPEPSDGGSASPDYAEQRRQQYAQRMQQLQEDAARRDEGIGRTGEEAAADRLLAEGPVPKDLAGQRRQQLAKERLFKEQNPGSGKGSGIMRRELIQIIRSDGGTTATVKE